MPPPLPVVELPLIVLPVMLRMVWNKTGAMLSLYMPPPELAELPLMVLLLMVSAPRF